MLQKLENLYLAILRFVIIVAAGVLLLAVVVLGLNSLRALIPEPAPNDAAPVVTDQALKQGMLSTQSQQPGNVEDKDAQTKSGDANLPFYVRAATAISSYVTTHSLTTESVDSAQVVDILRSRAEKYGDAKIASAFAKNFAESVERLLKDQAIIDAAKSSSCLAMVDKLLTVFTDDFDSQLQNVTAENSRRQQEYVDKKTDGMQSLYVAAGAKPAAPRNEQSQRELTLRSPATDQMRASHSACGTSMDGSTHEKRIYHANDRTCDSKCHLWCSPDLHLLCCRVVDQHPSCS